MTNAKTYFPDEILKQYKDRILPLFK